MSDVKRTRISSLTLRSSLGVAIVLLGASLARGECPPLPSASLDCRFDATLTRMFTPRTVPHGTYRVYVTAAAIGEVVAVFRAVASSSTVDGAWRVQDMDPLDAYGNAGPYDRAKVARLYLGVRARVARGPIVKEGRTVASITLVAPYPDGTLKRLETGTLIIELRIPAGAS